MVIHLFGGVHRMIGILFSQAQTMEEKMKNKKKEIEKYLVIDETDQAIISWEDGFIFAETTAKDFAEINDGHDIIIVKLSKAFRVIVPEEPQYEVCPMDLNEL